MKPQIIQRVRVKKSGKHIEKRKNPCLREGFLATDSAYGKVRFAVPRHALRFYFPALWPEAEQDEERLRAEGVG